MANRTNPFAIVTGASRGIGTAYARALAAQQYDLLLVSRDGARLTTLASELHAQHKISVDFEILDLALSDASRQLYAAAQQRRETVDLLINNAGFGLYGSFVTIPLPRIQEMLRLHINTIIESIRLFLPSMVEQRTGGIINVASIAGLFPIPYLAEYAATKAFLISFSEALAEEVKTTGVRIQVCCPGQTKTDFHATAGLQPRSPLAMQSSEEVVHTSLAELASGSSLTTIGWQGKISAFLAKWIPRTILLKATSRKILAEILRDHEMKKKMKTGLG